MKLSTQIPKMRFSHLGHSARLSLVAGFVITLALAVGSSRPKTMEDEILPMLGLKSGEMVTIDEVSKSEMAMTMNGQDYMIDYTVLSNRSRDFRLMVQAENGELVEQAAPAVMLQLKLKRSKRLSKMSPPQPLLPLLI